MPEVQSKCIFYDENNRECKALKALYCALEGKCVFCKLKGEYDAEGKPFGTPIEDRMSIEEKRKKMRAGR